MKEIEVKEDLWGYAKRLHFVCGAFRTAFPVRDVSDLTILDIGCGSGTQLALPLARLGYQLTGIDLHEPSINMAADLAKDLPNSNFLCGRIEDLNDQTFDAVILSEVLEHVTEPEKLLMAALGHVKDDGVVIVTVPNGNGEFEWDSWIFRGVGFERLVEKYEMRRAANGKRPVVSSTENKENPHIQFFTLGRLREIFRNCGLTIVDQTASTLLSGPFAGHTLARFSGFIDWNARIADKLPLAFSSGWFFALRRRSEGDE